MPALVAGTHTSHDHHARVITTSSGAAYIGSLEWDTFKDGAARRQLWMVENLYHQSKLVCFLQPPMPFRCASLICEIFVSRRMSLLHVKSLGGMPRMGSFPSQQTLVSVQFNMSLSIL